MINANYEIFKGRIAGKRVAVLGLGISNLPAVEFLAKCGANVTACDKNTSGYFDEATMTMLRKSCVELRLGSEYLENLDNFDVLVKSPGIRPDLPQIKKAVEAGAILTSEMEMFVSMCPCKIIGVTGSDGKTTTTTLIYEMLKYQGKNCHLGGNIGRPLLSELEYINENDFVILELSSFQLQTMRVSPDIAVITNISPNHLDYHKDMNEYIMAKANIFKFQNSSSKLVINADNPATERFSGHQKGELVMFSRQNVTDGAYIEGGRIIYKGETVMKVNDIRIRGVHNLENYLAAVSAVYGIAKKDAIVHVARNFRGVEHRMEYVRTVCGVEFYNDSIGSSPTRTIAGLVAHEGKIVLIAGGYDKKLSFDKLGDVICNRVTALVLCGSTADKIEKSVMKACGETGRAMNILKSNSFEDAIKGAFAMARSIIPENNEKVSVILSPACASFDMFKNFEIRGKRFKEIVNSLEE